MGVRLLEKSMETRSEKSNVNGSNGNGIGIGNGIGNGYYGSRSKVLLAWLDLRVFYIRISKCTVNDESTPEFLTLNHVPLNRDTLLDVNGVRSSVYSDGSSTLLRRDRLDKKSEEITFVSTDSLRTTGSVKFAVFDGDVVLVSGVLDRCRSDGVHGESNDSIARWRIECETDVISGNGFLKGNPIGGPEFDPPSIEVCLAGSFSGSPIILTKTLQVSYRKKLSRKRLLEVIPENEATGNEDEGSSSGLSSKVGEYPNYNPQHEYHGFYSGLEYVEGEDGELSWFNAGVRVGVGIGLSVCLGIGIGVGLLVRTYQGTTRNFKTRLL